MRRAELLEVRDVALRFGGIVALDGVSFALEEGQILGLIGPNGAGKTTLFNCVSRLYTPNRGDILFEGTLAARPPAAPHRRDRHRPDLSEPRAVPAPIGARQCPDRRARELPQRLPQRRVAAALGAAPGGGADRDRLDAARYARPRDVAHRAARGLAARHAQAGRTGPCARRAAEAAAARRAGRRAQSRRGRANSAR